MAELRAERYGRTGGGARDARSDRTLKIIGAVLGAVAVVVLGWAGVRYVSGRQVSGELIAYKIDSAHRAQARLQITKDPGAKGVCTLRSLKENGDEVGRKDVSVGGPKDSVNTVVTVRTTARAAGVELEGCETRG
jgi:hypothetical protein